MTNAGATKQSPALRIFLYLLTILFLAACSREEIPSIPDLPESIQGIPDVLDELGLPDISQVANLPEIEDLPLAQAPPGGMIFNGPTEYRVAVGERIPGTDMELTAVTDAGAEFAIAGLRSVRSSGDSLDYDGGWPGLDGVTYNLRTRIYRIGASSIRAAGVHQLTVENIDPVESDGALREHTIRFPYGGNADRGQVFKGMTLGYAGSDDRGGEIAGLPAGDYPYRKTGDSIVWRGLLRSDIPIEYAVRMVLYGESNATIGGVAKVSLPNH